MLVNTCVTISLYFSNLPTAFCSLLPHCPVAIFLNGLHTFVLCPHKWGALVYGSILRPVNAIGSL